MAVADPRDLQSSALQLRDWLTTKLFVATDVSVVGVSMFRLTGVPALAGAAQYVVGNRG